VLEYPDEPVREVVFPVMNEQTLRDLVAEYKAQGGSLSAKSAGGDALLVSQSLSLDSPGSAGGTRLSFQQYGLSASGRGAYGCPGVRE
jgi:hypothetical protein